MSLIVRRQSFNGGPTPRITIPATKDSVQCDSISPTISGNSPLLGGLEPQLTTTSSSNLTSNVGLGSPELQPITPPVLSGKNQGIFQIGSYLLVEELDCNVHKAVNIHTHEEKICKIFSHHEYRTKIAAYNRLYEKMSVVAIHEILRGHKSVYVFFEKHYGDLHSYVRSKRRIKEDEAVNLYRQIAEAVNECHQCGVVVRDLKLRKFVFTNPERTRIQLEGLEDSHILHDEDDDTLCDKQGCPAYVSPEILLKAQSGYSGKASDQWSSGVMLYTMLIGRYPFQDSDPATLFKKIKLGKYSIPPHLSSRAKCLIRNLLRLDSSERLTSEQVLNHPWLNSYNTDLSSPMVTINTFANDQLVPKWNDI